MAKSYLNNLGERKSQRGEEGEGEKEEAARSFAAKSLAVVLLDLIVSKERERETNFP